ncbi:hypothetical protein [Nonlabens antarcticus]|uniref:hypothetical protein n=1 Tax=Nonlabens antarcticus TaxID=392714 RepID=UPI001891BF88|nr:hypothetical protein [Nonlabens antarcticus]
MKKIFFTLIILFLATPTFMGCRDEKTVEVEELAPDADDSGDDEGFDTNPTESDPD